MIGENSKLSRSPAETPAVESSRRPVAAFTSYLALTTIVILCPFIVQSKSSAKGACKPCDAKCKTCKYLSPTWCESCDSTSDFPFLDGNTCTSTCGFGRYGNFETAQCEECGYNCQSCEFGPDTCRSCHPESVNKHYFEGECLSECPSRYVADSPLNDNVCIPCNPNCMICSGSPDVCSTCSSGKALNLLDYECTD